MPLAVELYFDAASDRRVRRLCSDIAAAGIPVPTSGDFRPHISLTGVADEHAGAAKQVVESLARSTSKFLGALSAVGSFPGDEGVVFLVPSVSDSDALLAIHQRAHDEFDKLSVPLPELYTPGRWVPHCTVSIGASPVQVPEAVAICRASDVFGPIVIAGVLLLDIEAKQEVMAVDFS